MKQIIEYLPIIIFTITYFYTRDIFFATLILLISLFSQVCLEYLLEKKVSKKTKIIFGISLLFGGSTIFFRNEEFLFWRPTVINWIFSVLLLSVEFFSGKNLLKMIMGKTILLPDNVWRRLSCGWSLGFFISGLLIQVCLEYLLEKKVSKKTKIIFGISLLFGGSTIFFRNEEFLFWRPTVINWIFSVLLLSFEFFSGKNLLKLFMGKAIILPDNVWKKLSRGWSLGFFISGLLNIIIAYNFTLDFWVSYKLFGGFLITLTYLVIMMIYLWRGGYLNKKEL